MKLNMFIFWLILQFSTSFAGNDKPVIGVFTAPSSAETSRDAKEEELGHNYLVASYVKWIEQAGARAVPIPYRASREHLDEIFESVNGLLFPGGGTPIDTEVRYIYEKALEANRKGDYFPVWGTCLGFEWIVQLHNGYDFNETFNAENMPVVLDFTHQLEHSRVFADARETVVPGLLQGRDGVTKPLDLLTVFRRMPVSFNNHMHGITPERFLSDEKLRSFFRVIATNQDRDNKPFVAIIEARDYPIYGFQWHPEKNQFEWGVQNDNYYQDIPHTRAALLSSAYLADFFVSEARKSNHKFPSLKKEDSALVWNYPLIRTGDPAFVQTYEMKFPSDKLDYNASSPTSFDSFRSDLPPTALSYSLVGMIFLVLAITACRFLKRFDKSQEYSPL